MPDPLVVIVQRQFAADLAAAETLQMREMAQRWLTIEHSLQGSIDLLAADMAAEKEAGRAVSQAKLYRMQRYQALMGQLQGEVQRYAEWAERQIEQRQTELVSLGVQQATTAIQVSMQAGAVSSFNILDVRAVEAMAALVSEQSPLTRLLKASYPDALGGLSDTLLIGTALGWGPARTAAEMRRGMSMGLNRSLNIARTEQLRALRMASSQQYQESGVVIGHKRIAAKFGSCAACLARDGEMLLVDEPVYDHPSGRCSSVPIIEGVPAPSWQSGRDWLNEQPVEYQRKVLGAGRYAACKAGKFKFDDLATTTHHDEWGKGLAVKPLSELVSTEKAA